MIRRTSGNRNPRHDRTRGISDRVRTWQLGGDWGSFDEQEAIAAIRHARQLGINFFDTAHAYGYGVSEQMLGRALRDELRSARDQVLIATKGGLRMDEERGQVRDSSPGWLRQGVEDSLRALGLDYIDLYQVHWPDPETPLAESAQALQEMVDEGKIRHVGVSNFSSPRWPSSPERVPSRRSNRPTTCSAGRSSRTCSRTRASTTSACSSTGRSRTDC